MDGPYSTSQGCRQLRATGEVRIGAALRFSVDSELLIERF